MPPSSERTPYATDDGWSPSERDDRRVGIARPRTRHAADRVAPERHEAVEDVDERSFEDGFDVVVRRLPAVVRRAGEYSVGHRARAQSR